MENFDCLFENIIWGETDKDYTRTGTKETKNKKELFCDNGKIRKLCDYKKVITKEVNEKPSVTASTKYIQKLQLKFCEYIRLLRNIIDFEEINEDNESELMNKCLLDGADEMLNFLEVRYTTLIDYSRPCSYKTKLVESVEIDLFSKEVAERIEKQRVSKKLKKITNSFLGECRGMVDNEYLTYYDLVYMKILLNDIAQALRVDDRESDQIIEDVLLVHNFNNSAFFQYMVDRIFEKVEHNENLIEKIDILNYQIKIMNQKMYVNNFIYKQSNMDIIRQISAWIKEEVRYYKEKLRFSIEKGAEADDELYDLEKIILSLSVGQIACILYVFIEAGIIDSGNKKNVFRIVAKFIKSKRSHRISAKSLMNKYYDIDTTTWRSVQDLLFDSYKLMKKLSP